MAKDWESHITLQRMWLILCMIHSALSNNPGPQSRPCGLAACAKGAKALLKATRQKGVWAGAWAYTYLPEPNEIQGGISIYEEASSGRWMREKAAIAKAV